MRRSIVSRCWTSSAPSGRRPGSRAAIRAGGPDVSLVPAPPGGRRPRSAAGRDPRGPRPAFRRRAAAGAPRRRPGRDPRGGGAHAVGRAGGLPDRDGLRAGSRRPGSDGGRPDLRRQGAAVVRSAHRPPCRCDGAGRIRPPGGRGRPRVARLASRFWPGPLTLVLRKQRHHARHRHGRPVDRGAARAGPSGRPGPHPGGGGADRRPVGQPVRARLADAGEPRRARAGVARRAGPRRRAVPGWRRVHRRAPGRGSGGPSPAWGARGGGDRSRDRPARDPACRAPRAARPWPPARRGRTTPRAPAWRSWTRSDRMPHGTFGRGRANAWGSSQRRPPGPRPPVTRGARSRPSSSWRPTAIR